MKNYEKIIENKIKELETKANELKAKREGIKIVNEEYTETTRKILSIQETMIVLYRILNGKEEPNE